VIVDPDPSDFPDAVRVRPEDIRAGIGAGGSATVAGPSSEP
jgi:hypothetical protein